VKYENVCPAVFLERLNRFAALAEVQGKRETVHVKNTGRCRELLVPGSEIWLCRPDRPGRKTAYDLITVRKGTGALFNIDSQAPNRVALEWLREQDWDEIRPEYTYGASRIDFFMRRGNDRYLMEVKGCTLEVDGIGYFPDAPTERGVKHLRELTAATKIGYKAILAFVIQMDGISVVKPNNSTHAEFGAAMDEAKAAGVEVLFLKCHVEPDTLVIVD
jgi:sugar fermentation stimulation protein A